MKAEDRMEVSITSRTTRELRVRRCSRHSLRSCSNVRRIIRERASSSIGHVWMAPQRATVWNEIREMVKSTKEIDHKNQNAIFSYLAAIRCACRQDVRYLRNATQHIERWLWHSINYF